jgi:23S rRNA G2445 N2-methylase RlmL
LARAPDFDLTKALASPSFTPGQRDAGALVELVVGGADPAAQQAAVALAKLGEAGRKAIDARLSGGGPVGGDTAELGDAATARLVGALGLFARAGDAAALAAIVERTRDVHVRVRRAAISALGKVRGDAAREALLARWDATDVTPDERRALVEALGKIGGADVLEKLKALDTEADDELERRRKRAALMIARTDSRGNESAIDADAPLPHEVEVVLTTKRGLEPLLAEELAAKGFAPGGTDGGVLVKLAGRWSALYASRLWLGAAIRVPMPPGTADDLEDRIVAAIGSELVAATLRAMTRGDVRYRLGFGSGKRRALIWRLADRIPYLNDPTDSTWEIFVDEQHGHLEIAPKKAVDPRFAWRVAEVPAASHPTVAAALAFVAGARPTDRVWDPFVGSGAELVERARLGPFTSLTGTDLDDRAIEAARRNVDAAGITARLERGDALAFDPGGSELVITNPPLGSRLHVDAAALLASALPHLVRVLVPSGRLVWITPSTRKTTPVAQGMGLRRTRSLAVDLGGVRGHLERWEKP